MAEGMSSGMVVMCTHFHRVIPYICGFRYNNGRQLTNIRLYIPEISIFKKAISVFYLRATARIALMPYDLWWKTSAITDYGRFANVSVLIQNSRRANWARIQTEPRLFNYMSITVVSPKCQFANDQVINFEVDSSTSRSHVWTVLFIAFTRTTTKSNKVR